MTYQEQDAAVAMSFDEMEQYGRNKAQEIQERRERRKLEQQRITSDNKLKAAWAPRIWAELREILAKRVQAVNDALGENALIFDAFKPDSVIIQIAHVRSNLSAVYDPPTGKITLALDDHMESYDLEVVKGEVKLKAVGYFTPAQLAKMLVDKAASMVI